jgi:uncharacterized membrane protein YccC
VSLADQKIALEAHPRAQRSISRLKGLGGLGCFFVVGFLSLRAGVPFFDAGLRALVAGVVGYAVAWFGAVQVWRHVAVAEIKRHRADAIERQRRIHEEIEAARAESRQETPA